MELQGKVAFVTGAAGGIGRASAIALARAGATVVVTDLSAEKLDETVSLIAKQGGKAWAIVADITDRTAIQAAIAQTVTRFGSIDCAHNNAGLVLDPKPFAEFSIEEFRRTFEVNVFGTVNCMQAEIAAMLRQKGGTIVNTASIAGMVASPGNSAYCASKQAVVGLTRNAAIEYAGRGIRINAVCPGVVQTAMTAPVLADEAIMRAAISMQPVGRLGGPEEIADVVVWLSSARSSYVVGSMIIADGGYSAQ